jgi:hypothetical protein
MKLYYSIRIYHIKDQILFHFHLLYIEFIILRLKFISLSKKILLKI